MREAGTDSGTEEHAEFRDSLSHTVRRQTKGSQK